MCKCTQVINKLPLEFAAVILLCVFLCVNLLTGVTSMCKCFYV